VTVNAPLIGQIRKDLADLGRVVAETLRLAQKAQATGDDDYLSAAALNLHGFYAGTEGIFKKIANDIDESIPGGIDSHRRLLQQMSAEIPGIRPPVINSETQAALDEYRSFRHVVRNVYTLNLRSSRIRELASDLPACYAALTEDLSAFNGYLEELDAEDSTT